MFLTSSVFLSVCLRPPSLSPSIPSLASFLSFLFFSACTSVSSLVSNFPRRQQNPHTHTTTQPNRRRRTLVVVGCVFRKGTSPSFGGLSLSGSTCASVFFFASAFVLSSFLLFACVVLFVLSNTAIYEIYLPMAITPQFRIATGTVVFERRKKHNSGHDMK